MVIESTGRFLLTVVQESFVNSRPIITGINVFNIDANGALELIFQTGLPSVDDRLGLPTTDPTGRFLYIPGNTRERNQPAKGIVMGVQINPDGSLSSIPGSPFDAGITPDAICVHPTGRFAYVTSGDFDTQGNVLQFLVDPVSGALTPVPGTPVSTGRCPKAFVMEPTGRFAYVSNACDNTISAFSVDQVTGALKEIKGSPFQTGAAPISLQVDTTGRSLYVANVIDKTIRTFRINQIDGSLSTNTDDFVTTGLDPIAMVATRPTGVCYALDKANVTKFNIDLASGTLGQTGSPLPLGVQGASVIVCDPTARFAYVLNSVGGTGSSGSVLVFAVDRDGNLSAQGSVSVPAAGNAAFIAIDPSARFAYVANQGTPSSISIFSINRATGMLWPITGSQVTVGSGPITVAADPTGRFAYVVVANMGNSLPGVMVFSINPSTGTLTPLFGFPLQSDPPTNTFPLSPFIVHPRAIFAYSVTADSTFPLFTINPATGALSSNGSFNLSPQFMALHPSGGILYAATSGALFALGIVPATGQPIQTGAAAGVGSMTVHQSGLFLYGTQNTNVSLFMIDLATGNLTQSTNQPLPTGNTPISLVTI
jgi:6-phosphogluconolactonase (cycloisomerase 2 family)